jgi:hypothetical protein
VQTAVRVTGEVTGNVAPPGTPITLRFVFYDDGRLLGNESIEVAAPADGEQTTFEVQFAGTATAYRYEFVAPPPPDPAAPPAPPPTP